MNAKTIIAIVIAVLAGIATGVGIAVFVIDKEPIIFIATVVAMGCCMAAGASAYFSLVENISGRAMATRDMAWRGRYDQHVAAVDEELTKLRSAPTPTHDGIDESFEVFLGDIDAMVQAATILNERGAAIRSKLAAYEVAILAGGGRVAEDPYAPRVRTSVEASSAVISGHGHGLRIVDDALSAAAEEGLRGLTTASVPAVVDRLEGVLRDPAKRAE
jgi:flagellar basal body-associated protein FliL